MHGGRSMKQGTQNTTGYKAVSDSPVELTGYLAEFRDALNDEIDAVKKNGSSTTLLFGGHRIPSKGAENWYQFRVQYMPSIPSDTLCKLTIGNTNYQVTVINVDTDSLIISSKEVLPDTIAKAQLENGSIVLMEQLIKRIEKNAKTDNRAGSRMLEEYTTENQAAFSKICDKEPEIGDCDDLNAQQISAIANAVTYDISYIWGPPGTGKTTVISHIIQELFNQSRSVLLVSHTNTAVDGAIVKVDLEYQKLHHDSVNEVYPILRFGEADVPEHLLMDAHVKTMEHELFARRDDLAHESRKLGIKLNNLYREKVEATWIQASNVNGILLCVDQYRKTEELIADLHKQYSDTSAEVKSEREKHPEVAEYSTKLAELGKHKSELNTLSQQRNALDQKQSYCVSSIDEANLELSKYHTLKSLRQQLSSHTHMTVLEEHIKACNTNIAQKESQTVEMETALMRARDIILSYESSNVFSRIGKKKTYDEAIKQKEYIDSQLTTVKNNLEINRLQLHQYKAELYEVKDLEQQISAIQVTQTEQYWDALLQTKTTELHFYIEQLREVKKQLAALDELIYELQKAIDDINMSCGSVFSAEKKLKDLEHSINATNETKATQYGQLSSLVMAELSLVSGLFSNNSQDLFEVVNELAFKYTTLRTKYSAVGVKELEQQIAAATEKIAEIRRQQDEIEEKLSKCEKQVLLQTKIIGTTLTKAYLNDDLQSRKFDTVILDEASMASIPALWCVCLLAEKNIVIVGDFLQLPPIVMAETKAAKDWLGTDIFIKNGISERIKKQTAPVNISILTQQYRMEKDIADIANYLCYKKYHASLKSNDHSPKRKEKRDKFYEWYSGNQKFDNPIYLVDTKELHAWATGVKQGTGHHSRLNYLTAAFDVNMAFQLLERELVMQTNLHDKNNPRILIIAPYKPHVEVVQKMVQMEYENRGINTSDGMPDYIKVGTVNSFQGKEADIVIFDLVIDEPHYKANLFMPDEMASNNLNMLNVAITRARFKLYIVGNFGFCLSHSKGNALNRFLTYLTDVKGIVRIDAKKLIPHMNYNYRDGSMPFSQDNSNNILCREDSFEQYLLADFDKAKKQIVIFSPFITENRVSTLLLSIDNVISRGVEVYVITKTFGETSGTNPHSKRSCEGVLISHGVHIIHRKGMHEKIVFIDDSILWRGSLNVLSFSGATGEIMERSVCSESSGEENIIRYYKKIIDLEHIINSVNEKEQVCPICHCEMILKESDKGGLYWMCEQGDYSRGTDKAYAKDGVLLCQKCGGQFTYVRKNEPRWVCAENPNHYQRIKKSDLILPKMKALIRPKSELDIIADWFNKSNT